MKLYSPNIQKVELLSKLHVNTGVISVLDERGNIAYFPKTDWLSPASHFEFSDVPENSGSKFINVLKVDPYIKQLFWKKIAPLLLKTTSEIRAKIMKNYSMSVIDMLVDLGFFRLKRLYSYELVFNPPNKISTAYDYKNNHQVGLHIDTHHIKCLWQRRRGFELLSINLGEADRYFYYINLEVNQLRQKLRSLHGEINHYKDVNTIKNDFLHHYSDYAVNRITIKPDEAYIGISQNFIHDGGTNTLGKPDVTLLIGGFFEWKR